MRTVLVTGANRGIGLHVVWELARAGYVVYLGSRDPGRGDRAAREAGATPLPIDVTPLPIDVTDDASVRAAAATVRERSGRLDVLVNNAGILGPVREADTVTPEEVIETYDTNVFGAVRTMHAFLPLLRRSDAPVVVNVGSGLGSITAAADPEAHRDAVPVWVPSVAYGSSKAALTMLTVQYARAFPTMRINAVDPGYTDSGSMARPGAQPIEDGADIVVRMARLGPDGPSGGFFSSKGDLPW